MKLASAKLIVATVEMRLSWDEMTIIPNGCRRAIASRMWGWNENEAQSKRIESCLVVAGNRIVW